MTQKFTQITTGSYSYDIVEFGETKRKKGHCLYGVDDKGQIWKWAIREGVGKWVEFEKCLPNEN